MIILQIQLTADHGHLNAGKRQVLCTLVRTATIIKIMFLIFVIKVILKYFDQVRASGSYTRRQRGRKTLRNNGLRQPYSCKKH